MDTRARVLKVLKETHLMSLATRDDGGLWVVDLIFVYDDSLTLYWMSDPECRHSMALLKNSQVAGSITASNKKNEPNLGIQFTGIAEKIMGTRHDLAIKHFAKRGHPTPPQNEDILEGDSWYQLTLTKVRLIDESYFGFNTQDIAL